MRAIAASLFLIGLLAAGCATPAATDAPTSAPSSEPSPTTAPSPTPSPTPSSSPTPTDAAAPTEGPNPTPSPAPSAEAASSLTIRWNRGELTGLDSMEAITGVVRAGDTYVLLGSMPYVDDESPSSVAWWSRDGRSWKLAQAFPPEVRLLTITAGGPGFVAAGLDRDRESAAVWTSIDGRTWQAATDPSLGDGVIGELVATESGIVGFGWRSDNDDQALWTSADGVEWLAATNETGLAVARGLQAVGSYGGRAIAFVSEGEDEPPSIWETTGRAEWTRTGQLNDVAQVARVAGGARGWVALDGRRAWTSPDGAAWRRAVPGPDVTSDVVVDDAGFVAVGYVGSLPGETCGDQRDFAGLTWTSADGRVWNRMKVTREFRSAMVTKLLVVDRTLIGYGQLVDSQDGSNLPVARWTDTLPPAAERADDSDEASVFEGCGG